MGGESNRGEAEGSNEEGGDGGGDGGGAQPLFE
jgi:hypothetical protein